MGTRVYDSNEVLVVFGPNNIDAGRADGEFVKITREAPAFTSKVGCDGDVTRSRMNDNRAKVEITIMQTSPSNDILSAQHALDKITPNGDGIMPLLIKDNSGRSLHTALHAWIETDAEVVYDREAGTRTWSLECSSLASFIGGSGEVA
jgi:hypothetical protein